MSKVAIYALVFCFALLSAATVFWWLGVAHETTIPLALNTPCDLSSGGCQASLNNKTVSLNITPKPIPIMQPIQVDIDTTDFESLSEVGINVEGVNMFMGYQVASLSPTSAHHWQGSFILPICTQTQMQWKATLTLRSSQGIFQAEYPFNTSR
jgi:hypothetical protein